ncbi:MAG: AIR synthase family protein [Salinirussus sp.]
MSDLGKVDREFFERVIFPRLGADRADVTVGPRHGVDFGVLSVGESAVVLATDPVSVLPDLGWEQAARLALEVVLADVAVSGVGPTHLTISLSLPPGTSDDDLEALWRGIDGHASELGVSIVAGHTARYPGIDTSWVGAATAIGVGDSADVVRPDGARPGDSLIVTTGPAAEVAGLFATLYPESLGLSAETTATAQERITDIEVVADARTAASGDVSAMHDATEGGLQGALVEMARGADVRFDVDTDRVPTAPGAPAVCAATGMDPWTVSSAGTLVIAVAAPDADGVVAALRSRGTRAAVVGSVREGQGVYVDGKRRTMPERDPSWAVAEELAGDG